MKRTFAALMGSVLLGSSVLSLSLLASAHAQGASPSAAPSWLSAPDGFKVTTYAGGFKAPRLMAVAPNGDIFMSDQAAGIVYVLPDRNKDGVADSRQVFASGLRQPHGLAFHGDFLYVADTDAVLRFPYKAGDLKATAGPTKLVDLPSGAGHSTRTIVFGPDDRMYVSVGSSCNVCEESDPRRAAVWSYTADGKDGKPYATGLRNAVGLAWQDGTLYASMNNRDNLGDNIPPETFFRLKAGGFYGWPYCYNEGGEQVYDKDFGRRTPAACDSALPAFATVVAHSAPLGIGFYTGTAFPQAERGMLFAALHGSWNRSAKSGYKVVMINPQSGKVSDFLTGFLQGQDVRGRPAGVQMTPDGALLVTDDQNGAVYRVAYP